MACSSLSQLTRSSSRRKLGPCSISWNHSGSPRPVTCGILSTRLRCVSSEWCTVMSASRASRTLSSPYIQGAAAYPRGQAFRDLSWRDNVRAVPAVPPSLARDLDSIVKTLRTTPAGRLRARLSGPYQSRADAGRALARVLAIAAQGIEDADQPAMTQWREPP